MRPVIYAAAEALSVVSNPDMAGGHGDVCGQHPRPYIFLRSVLLLADMLVSEAVLQSTYHVGMRI